MYDDIFDPIPIESINVIELCKVKEGGRQNHILTRESSATVLISEPLGPLLIKRSRESTTKLPRAMARVTSVLPSSLSPHICIISSPDLVDLLSSLSLPPLPQILQSFSPLPQGKTRLIRGTNTSNSHMQLLSHNEDNVLDTGSSHLFCFTLLRLGRGRRRVS